MNHWTKRDGKWAHQWIQNLKLTGDYAGEPFKLLPFQKQIVEAIFAQRNAAEPKYSRIFCFLPRSSGKSELIAGTVLCKLLGDPRPNQIILSAAAKREQAEIIFERCAFIIEQDEYLKSLCEVKPYYREIHVHEKHSYFKALSTDTQGSSDHGKNFSYCVVDDLHSQRYNRKFYDAFLTGLGKRPSAQLCVISTAGDIGSIVEDEFRYALKVQENPDLDPDYWSILYYLEKDAKCLCGKHDAGWKCEQQWHRVNPALSKFKSIRGMQTMFRQALQDPAVEHQFRCYHLNEFLTSTENLIPYGHWQKCAEDFDEEELIGKPAVAGIDLAAVSDFSALVLLFKQDDHFKILPFFWLPKDRLQEIQNLTRAPVVMWAEKGYIRTTEGDVTDFEIIRKDINEIAEKYPIEKIGLDPWNSTQLAVQLEEDGFHLEWIKQNYASMSAPTKEMVRQIIAHKIKHPDNPVMNFMAQSAVATTNDDDAIRITRKDRSKKCDGVVALAEAVAMAGLCQPKSIYEDRGAIII